MADGLRPAHLLTGIVAASAVVLQFVLVWQGHAVLDAQNPPTLATRVERFFCYFTVLSNILVAAVSIRDATGTSASSRLWRVLRLNAVVGICVTAVVHWFALRPLLDLHGADLLADKLLHVVVPVLAVFTWVVAGPRGQVLSSELVLSSLFPALYMLWTLVHGAWRHWYPYPFADVRLHGYAVVLLNSLAVVALMVVLSFAALLLDRRLSQTTANPPTLGHEGP